MRLQVTGGKTLTVLCAYAPLLTGELLTWTEDIVERWKEHLG